MLPRDADGEVIDPVEDLDDKLEPAIVGLHDPDREAKIRALEAM